MKKKAVTQKLAAMVMTTVLAATTLAGCGNDGGERSPQESSGAQANSGSSENDSEASAENGGQNDENSSWIADEPITVSVMLSDNSQQPKRQDAPAHEEIFRKTNIQLEFQIVPAASYEEKQSVVLGTNNFPDVIYLQNGTKDIVQYGTSGIFEPLMQYVNEETMPNFYKFWQQYPDMKKYLLEGELYAFPVVARDESAAGFGPVIRMDLLEKHDIPIPQTFDELLEALAKLHEIYPDTIPWTGRKGTPQLLATTAYMLGSGMGGRTDGMYYDFDEKKYIFGPASENFKEVLGYLNKAYEMGVLDPEFATTTDEQMDSKLSSGKSLFYLDNSGFGANYTAKLNQIEGYEDARFQVLPIPENSFGNRRAVAYAADLPGRFYAINASAENKEEIIKLIDWLYSREGSDITNYGVEGISFEYGEDGEPHFIEDYVMQFKGAEPSDYYAVFADLGITKLDFCFWAGNTRMGSEIQKITGSWTELTDEYWEIINNDPAYVQPHINPSLTEEEAETVQDILAEVNTILEPEYNKYIMGTEPVDNWDSVIKKCEDAGVRQIEEIYNAAEARANAQ
ncbi:extracellular solute-binding protein [Acetatifactor muris]|uniref:extracellular solute-binding protein n=1 Tax=Acetatifactor muris TaxID=879566 RepID=UPI0023F39CB6|nr:extracellular solute-binding protein [Acetatifactor muris]